MPIARVGKFLETADLGIVHSLGIESGQLDDCVAEINRRGIRGVFGCPVFGFQENNLDFLDRLHEIRQVWFWEVDLKDVAGLYSQKTLEYFGISPKRPAIDFSSLPRLRNIVWHPIKHDTGIEKLKRLEHLDVWRFKTKDMSFAELQLPESIRKLDFNWCNQDSISALPVLPNLEELQFHYCRNLKSLDGLRASAPNLKKLVVTRCANLETFEEAMIMNLEHIYINVRGKEVANNVRELMSSPNYDDPAVEKQWSNERRAEVVAYLKREGVTHGRIGEWPAWHIAPYVSIWAIESAKRPAWVGGWVICGDLPTDYLSADTIKHPREAMRSISERWLEVSGYMERGEKHPSINIGSPDSWPQLGPLLKSRSQLLAKWVRDDSVWEE